MRTKLLILPVVVALASFLPQSKAGLDLGSADSFAVLGASTVTSTGGTVLNGNLGLYPGTSITGFYPPAIVNGTIYETDTVAKNAQADALAAYNSLAGQAVNAVLTGQDLGGLTLTPGVYFFSSSAQLNGTLTLSGSGQFVFQIGSTLTTASASSVLLTGGAQAGNVFWQVGSSATLGASTSFDGTILADTGITLDTGASLVGRALALNGAVTLIDNVITVPVTPVPTGTLAGHVQGNGAPVANAQVRIKGTVFTGSTDSSGAFTLNNVPVGAGYLVTVGAAGFASKQVPGVAVSAGTTDMGTIALAAVGGPSHLVTLAPDVNPSTTTVEVGGTAYRYYLALNSANQPQGDVTVSAQVSGGNPIPQSGDVSAYWPGQTAGVSDADGIVRVSIPAADLGTLGVAHTVQLSVAGQVQQTFQAEVALRSYDQVWKQKLGAGASVEALPLVSVEGDASGESELRRTMVNGAVTAESISRIRTTKGQLSVGENVGSSLSVSSAPFSFSGGAEAGAEANGFLAGELRSTYGFDPSTADQWQNAMKLYLDLGNVLSGVPGPAGAFYQFAEATVEPLFLGSNLQSVEGDVIVGGGLDLGGQVGFSVAGGSEQAQVDLRGGLSADMEGILGAEASFGLASESAVVVGVAASGSAMAGGGISLGLGELADLTLGNLSFGWETSAGVELVAKSWTRAGQSGPYRAELLRKLSLDAGNQNPVGVWQRYDPQALYGTYEREFTETLGQANGNSVVNYRRSVYAAQQDFGLNLNLDLGVCGVNLEGELDHGAEAANERGVIQRSRYWPTESYPAVTAALFPTQSWLSVLLEWGNFASGPIGQAVSHAVTTIGNTANNIVQAGQQDLNATLAFGQNVMARGSQVVSSWVAGLSGGAGDGHVVRPKDKTPPPLPGPLPPLGASNYIYGVSGIYRFASSNSFNGTGTLAIGYSAAQVAGLYEPDLRIYRLDDNTNRWVLAGGTVSLVSNLVSATITNLGTYAVAPPLPTGSLWLQPSTNSLPADGVSQITVVVSNLLLNTGGSATQAWLFTASAVGVDILSSDADTNTPGVQIVSTNATLTLQLRAPVGGTYASVSLKSFAGDGYGQVGINLVDNTPPATPKNVVLTAGQSRIWVSWQTNTEPDIAGYRIYYRLGTAGPPWDGTAAVEGTPSPVTVTGANCLLRGLSLGTNYFVAVSAVDTTGNESPLSPPQEVTTSQGAPAPPTSVAVRFGQDGTNILMWALSEDDGYNDRDVVYYEVWRAVLPGGSYVKAGQVAAGVGVFSDTNVVVSPGQYVSYAVTAVASSGANSSSALALILIAAPTLTEPAVLPDGSVQFNLSGTAGLSYTVQASTNLVDWVPVLSFVSTNGTTPVVDPAATNFNSRFYRARTP